MSEPSRIVSLRSSDQFEAAIRSYDLIHGATPASFWNDMLYEHPEWSAEDAHRAIFDGDRAAALTSLARWRQRFGNTTLGAGEIGLVGTLPDYRKRGLSRQLMESWLATMKAESVPVAFLIGIPNFYERWNFHYACPDHVNAFLSIAHDPLLACSLPAGNVRPLDPERELDRVIELIAYEHRHIPCSPVIGADLLGFFVRQADVHGVDWRVIEDSEGDICAVVRWKRWADGIGPQAAGAVTLAAATDDQARGMLAGVLTAHFPEANQGELELAIPPHGRFGEWLFQRGARRKSSSSIFRGGYAAMYRINDLPMVLEALRTGWDEPTLCRKHDGVSVTIRVGRDTEQVATMTVAGDGIEIAAGDGGTEIGAPPAVTIPWVTGWRSAADWIEGTPYPARPER